MKVRKAKRKPPVAPVEDLLLELERLEEEKESVQSRCREVHVRIGAQMRAVRKERKVTLENVALELSCSKMWVSALERGKKNWTREWVEKYRVALDEALPF